MQETQKIKNMENCVNTGVNHDTSSWIKTCKKDIADLLFSLKTNEASTKPKLPARNVGIPK